jgi:glycosyltransferase involved in cell wall biosynthesis
VRVAVIPAHNEAATIGTVVLQTQPHVETVIVIDDGSTDKTAEIAQLAGARVCSHDQNKGKGAAIQTGFELGMTDDADTLVFLDGDGQHDPDSIPALVEPIENGESDLVIGSRTKQGIGTAPRHRKVGRGILDTITNAINGTEVTDTQSGFRAMRAGLIEEMIFEDTGMGIESTLLTEAVGAGAQVSEIPVQEHYPKTASPNHNPVSHAVAVLGSILKIVRREHPLLVFGIIGAMSLLLGGYLGYDTTTHYWETQVFWPGRAMLSMLFAIIGTQLITAALILDSVNLNYT